MLRRFSILFASLLAVQAACAAGPGRGEQIYREQCLECHGDAGQGVEENTMIRWRGIARWNR